MHLQLAAQWQNECKNKLSLSLSPLLHLFVEIKVRTLKKKNKKKATIENLIWNNAILYSAAKKDFTLNIPFQWDCCAISGMIREILFYMFSTETEYGTLRNKIWS